MATLWLGLTPITAVRGVAKGSNHCNFCSILNPEQHSQLSTPC